jgi:hypothetical protein
MQLERTTISEKGWGSNEAFNVGKGWSLRSISLANGREGWEQALIGCLNEVSKVAQFPLRIQQQFINTLRSLQIQVSFLTWTASYVIYYLLEEMKTTMVGKATRH